MKKICKSILLILMCLLMAVPMLGFADFVENTPIPGETYYSYSIQKFDKDGELLFEDSGELPYGIATYADTPAVLSFNTPEEAARYIREKAKLRETGIDFEYEGRAPGGVDDRSKASNEVTDNFRKSFWAEFFRHTGIPDEGDYLLWHYDMRGLSALRSATYNPDLNCWDVSITFTFEMDYFTTAEQEAIVTAEVNRVLASLDLDGKTTYEKILTVHDWICSNVSYDYENLNDSSYLLKHSAYAALMNRTSVCQGYANLFYRMMLELGIDCRYISGMSDNGSSVGRHGWNIVRIDGKYYNIDCTWDSQSWGVYWKYFLDNTSVFTGSHFPEASSVCDPTTPEFAAAYPMGEGRYDPDAEQNTHTHIPAAEKTGVEIATCITRGYTGNIICIECGDTIEKGAVIPAFGHTEAAERINVKEATCSEYGYTGDIVCAVCNNILYIGEYIPLNAHTPSEERVDVIEATCTRRGYSGDIICTVCERILEWGERTPVKEHTPSEQRVGVREATCTDSGYTGALYCAVCDQFMESGTSIPALGHTPASERTNVKEATCTARGYTGDIICTVCERKLEYGESIPASGHTPSTEKINVKVATCTENGYTGDTLCSVCKEIIEKGKSTPATGHTPASEKINVKEATCTEEGYTGDTLCSVCKEIIEKGKSTPAKGHTPAAEKIKVKEATCTKDGYTGDTLCSVCKEITEKGAETPALGHKYENGYCKRCKEECPHEVTELRDAKDASCTEDGYSGDLWCSDCGLLLESGEVIAAAGHKWSDDKCSVCGEDKPPYAFGDVNGDGNVNITDAIELLKYIAGLDNNVVVSRDALDIDGNGSVNINDAIALLRKIAGLSLN